MIQTMQELLRTLPYSMNLQTVYFQQNSLSDSEKNCSILRIPGYALHPHEFRCFLSRRLPVVITHLNSQLQLAWSPDQLTEEFGKQICTMEDCEAQADPMVTSLANFMEHFRCKIDDVIWKVKVTHIYVRLLS
jgi:hypothetical protein